MKRARFWLILLFIFTSEAYAASYNSPQYSLIQPRVVSSGGQSQSVNFSLNKARVGSAFAGKAKSANFSMDATAMESGIVPHPPVLNPLTTPTNVTTQTLTGSKDADTGIYINGFAVVPLNHETAWQYEQALEEGDNTLVITARNQAGLESEPVYAAITLDTACLSVQDSAVNENPSTEVCVIADTSAAGINDGITVNQSAPQISGIHPPDGSTRFTNQGPVTFLTSAGDADGNALLYQYTVDGTIKSGWKGSPDFVWTIAGEKPGVHIIKVEVRNNSGGISGQEIKFCLFCPPPLPD